MQAASSTSRVPARRGLRLGAPSGATPAAGTSRAMLRQLGNAVAAVTARAASRRCAVAPSSASSGRVSLGAGLPTCGVGLRHLRPVHYAGTLSGRTAAAAVEGAIARTELPKNFDFGEEMRIYKWWQEQGHFKPNESAAGEPFVLSMPPPNVTGRLHMGHAMFATLQDIMVRHARMRGRKALWVPGTDHAGIATQSVVEKMLAKEGAPNRLEMGREAFTSKVWEWKAEYGDFITEQLRRLGASCDWDRERFTLDDGLSAAVLEAFKRLHDDGLIYRGSYMVNWSPAMMTAVSDLEVEYTEEPGFLYYFKYPLEGGGPDDYLPVSTTRPETILGDTAVAVHPEDPRYAKFVGKRVVVPCSGGRTAPVIADEYVDREFGTGALKITPGHDPNDYEIGKRHDLETINIMNKDATLNANAGKYAGMDRFAVRKALWSDMEAEGLVIKKDNYTMRVPRSQRSGEVVEPIVSEQWFVRMKPLATPALEAVADGRITILPDRFVRVYNNWLENIKDWCISRQLWWGHRIPVYYVHDSEAAAAASEDGVSSRYVVASSMQEASMLAKEKYGDGVVLRQDQDVLDTWFSSGLWPFSTLGWPNAESSDLKTFYPTQMMETGHDILFFWVSRMIMMGMHLTGQVPFDTVYLHGLVRDEKGRKMSKSLGNVVDPIEVISDCGTDALRFTLATGSAVGQDLNLSMERLTANRNFVNKLWNAGKYVLLMLSKADETEWEAAVSADFSKPEELAKAMKTCVSQLPLSERWVVSLLHQTIDSVTERFDKYDYNQAGITTYNFFWDEFADWAIEASKPRTYGDAAAAAATSRRVLVYVFERVLRLLHPYMPFVTEELWQALPHSGDALILAQWPSQGLPADTVALAHFDALKGVVRSIRNARAEYGVEEKRRIAATLVVSDVSLRASLEGELPSVALLAKLDADAVSVVPAAPDSGAANQVSLVVQDGLVVLLPMAGLFDVDKEVKRLDKQRQKIEKNLSGVENKLKNPKFMEKASKEYVEEAQAQAAEAREQLAMVDAKIEQVKAMAAA